MAAATSTKRNPKAYEWEEEEGEEGEEEEELGRPEDVVPTFSAAPGGPREKVPVPLAGMKPLEQAGAGAGAGLGAARESQERLQERIASDPRFREMIENPFFKL